LVIAWVFTIKSDYELNKTDYDRIIECEKNMSPKGNKLKEKLYAAKSMMKPFGLGYQKIDTYPNFCILYYGEYANFMKCKTCQHALYKLNIGKEMTLVGDKKLRYFSITLRL